MDLDAIKEKLLEVIQAIQEKAKELWQLIIVSPKNIAISCAAFLIFICIIVLLNALFAPKKEAETVIVNEIPFSPLVEEIIPPEEPSFEQDYGIFREPSKAWDEEEVDRWFAEPDGAIFEQLERANDATVNDIFGAVP